jgi:hypothetical protein
LSDTKQIFSPDQRSLLTAVLNRIIPAKDELPGAGNLGVAAYIEETVSANTSQTRLFNEGLAQISVAAGQNSAQAFEALPDAAKDELLKSVESAHPVFFDQLVHQTYNGYYTNPKVFKIIGYEVPKLAPPGAQPELLDTSLLDLQRQREPFWKKV